MFIFTAQLFSQVMWQCNYSEVIDFYSRYVHRSFLIVTVKNFYSVNKSKRYCKN